MIASDFNLAGTATVSGTGLSFGSAAKVTNTGTFILQPGASVFADCCQNPTQLVNQGRVVIPAPLLGNTTATIDGAAFTDQGQVTISKGATLDLQTAPSTFASGVPLAGGGTLLINNLANVQFTGKLALSGGTTLQVGTGQPSDEGTLTGTGTLSGTGTFSWVQGTVGANLAVASPVKTTISGNTLKVLDASYGPNTGLLTLGGATTLSGTGLFLTGHGTTGTSVLTNTGTFTPKPGSTISAQVCCVTAAQFVNKGKLIVNVGAGQTFAIPQPGAPGVAFINSATVNLKSGTFLFGQPGYTQTAGQTDLQGGDLTSPPPAPATADLQGGKLTGTGAITANVLNKALVDPGSSPTSEGVITIKGNYTQASAGKLLADIKGGTTAGTGYDQLAVTGHASLDGTLAINTGTFTPAGNDFFTVLTYATRTGHFAKIQPAPTPRYWVNYKPSSAVFSYGPWGVDSKAPITASFYSSVQQNLGTPDFWGRYIGDAKTSFANSTCVQSANYTKYTKDIVSSEVTVAHDAGLPILPVYFNYPKAAVDGYACGQNYAKAAIEFAERWPGVTARPAIPHGTAVFVDIEGDVSTNADFVKGWYDTFNTSFSYVSPYDGKNYQYNAGDYRAGYYADTNTTSSTFDAAYCAAVSQEAQIATNSYIWTNRPGLSPTNKATEPAYKARPPASCASQTLAWQYNAGTELDNVDTDEAVTNLQALPLWNP